MIENQKLKSNTVQIQYRNSKLTRLFQAYFEGRSMVKMIEAKTSIEDDETEEEDEEIEEEEI